MFGQGERKETHLWLENLPALVPTDIVEGRAPVVHYMAPGPDRWKDRSRTYQGIADAMADQWGRHVIQQLSLDLPFICADLRPVQAGGLSQ